MKGWIQGYLGGILLKSEGVKDVFKWLDKKCKEQKNIVEKAEQNFQDTKRSCYFEDEQCLIDSAEIELERAKERLNAYVDVKISVERYMRKLRHQGE